ncbi:MAG TPA: MaoC family dehydratase N-terminal domain-containing protein [Dehalococcoidia bacterium]
MAGDALITDQVRAIIGQESEPWVFELTTQGIRQFARAVGYTDRVYYDEEEARAQGYRSLPAPPAFLGYPVFDPEACDPTFTQPRSANPRIDLPLARVLDGGVEHVYEEVPCAGDRLIMRNRVTDIRERTGSIGRMVFIQTEQTFTNAETGRVVARVRRTIIRY